MKRIALLAALGIAAALSATADRLSCRETANSARPQLEVRAIAAPATGRLRQTQPIGPKFKKDLAAESPR